MAKSENQKLKLLYLLKELMEFTDDEHGLTTPQIIEHMKKYDIMVERKTVYRDIEDLQKFGEVAGFEIFKETKGRNCYYHVGEKQFELAELKLLVDAVQSSKFITSSKSALLIRKLESLTSVYEAGKLHRQVYVRERVKTDNEKGLYSVDTIHQAIGDNCQIRFRYFQWNMKKQKEYRRDGSYYQVSPWALSWDDENYYLIAFDSCSGKIKHYRVDKMTDMALCKEPRQGEELFRQFDMGAYARKMFGMYSGEEERVHLVCEKALAGVMIDRFGREVPMTFIDDEHFEIRVDVSVSPQFFGWVFGLGEGVKITAPDAVVRQMQEELKKRYQLYS